MPKPVAAAASKPAPIANVTGERKKDASRGARGALTRPVLRLTQEQYGAIVNTARTIAARNGGYVNKDMIYRELADHPAFQAMVPGPEGSNIQPEKAYNLLTPSKVFAAHKVAVQGWTESYKEKTGEEGDPYASPEEGGPKKGPFAKLARAHTSSIDWDEL